MILLLDTHIAVWSAIEAARLPREARSLIDDDQNELWVSAVSIWEIAIKGALGVRASDPIRMSGHDAVRAFGDAGYRLLPVTPAHAAAVAGLPRLQGDPFDRLLVAQARTEPMRLVTHDLRLAAYGSMVLTV